MTTITRDSSTVLDPSVPGGDTVKEAITKNSDAVDDLITDINNASFGIGDMLGANNLSDVANATTSLQNLGGTSVGLDLFTASNAGTARTTLGSGTTGDAVFLASNAATAQQAMDVEVGVDVQAYDAELPAKAPAYDTIYVGAGVITPSTTNGATASVVEDATNGLDRPVLSFPGVTSNSSGMVNFAMPENWDRSTVKVKLHWTAASGASAADDVRFEVQAGAFSDDDALDAALGTAVTIDDQVTAAGDLQLTVASSALTVGGSPALGDFIRWKITRDYDYGGTPLAEDAQLLGMWIQYGVDKTPAVW